MDDSDLVARLAQHRTVGAAPREELVWLAAHGELYRTTRGELLTQTASMWDRLAMVLSGHIAIYVDRGLGPRKVMEWGAGDVTGLLPYSRMTKAKSPGGDPVVVGAGRSLSGRSRRLPRDDPGVPDGHDGARAHDDRSRAEIHIQRPAGREDDIARQVVGRARARAEQSSIRGVAERSPAGPGARESRGCGAGAGHSADNPGAARDCPTVAQGLCGHGRRRAVAG